METNPKPGAQQLTALDSARVGFTHRDVNALHSVKIEAAQRRDAETT
jgi:hypothetical protein